MTRIMRDSLDPDGIPVGTPYAASYIDHPQGGWTPDKRARLAGSQQVNIATRPEHVADILDAGEAGDAPLTSTPDWVRLCHGAGVELPVVYCNRSQRDEVEGLCAQTTLAFGLLIATLDGTQVLANMSRVVGVQWAGTAITGADFDESIIYNDLWTPGGHAPPPPPPPPPAGGLVVDGLFGPLTITALQLATGASPDGIFGPLSRQALQRRLGVTPDGIVGPITTRALQARVGSAQDGIWGPDTTRHLQLALNAHTF